MLIKLDIKNFRCFKEHSVSFKPTTVVVGKNNAGKSTVIEAIRLLSIITRRFGGLNFENVPSWLEIPQRLRGVSPSMRGLGWNTRSIFHQYASGPATITATFSNGFQVIIYIGDEGRVFATTLNERNQVIATKAQAAKSAIPTVRILPPIGPLATDEKLLAPEYYRRIETSPISSPYFRNHIFYNLDVFEKFVEASGSSWPGIRIGEITRDIQITEPLALIVRDGEFAAEISWMGHGLQMWLQMMWFLVASNPEDTVVLDEPDVYMHADLQRRLMRFLKTKYKQVIVATHAVEIISEVTPSEILMIDRQKEKSVFADSLPVVQRLIDHIGAVHNLQLARLWESRCCLLVEGEDLELLRHFYNTIFPTVDEGLESIPHMSIGGWGGWSYAVGSSMLLKNSAGEEIACYCLLDRDYHTQNEIEKRQEEARRKNINLHVWNRKEVENYLLVPEAIARVLSRESTQPVATAVVAEKLQAIAESFRNEITDAFATEIHTANRGGGLAPANQTARTIVDTAWTTPQGRLSVIPGKRAFSDIAGWAQTIYGVCLSKAKIAKEIALTELDREIVQVLTALKDARGQKKTRLA